MQRNEELERLILEAPEQLTGYSVYGDWLTERGDPRGELIAVQVALADPARSMDQGLLWQEQYLLRTHREHLLGPLAGWDRWIEVEHTRGFLGKIKLDAMLILEDDGRVRHDVLGLVLDALASPEGRFVHSLHFDFAAPFTDFQPVMRRLARRGPYPALRELTISAGMQGAEGDLRTLWALFPRLRSLTVHGARGMLRLGEPCAPELEEVVFSDAGYLSPRELETFFAAELPQLRSVVLDATRAHVADYLEGLLAARNTPRLRKLSILRGSDSEALARRLARSKLLGQLRVLDLSSGGMSDEDALVLARSGHLAGLARLVVSDNDLTREGLTALGEACPNVVSDMQRNDDNEDDYDAYD